MKTIALLMALALPAHATDLAEPPSPYADVDAELKRLRELLKRMCEESGIPPQHCANLPPAPTTQEP